MTETLQLSAGDARLVVDLGAGGRLASLHVAGAERLVTSAPPGGPQAIMWGCYLMAPWAGRLGDGRVPLDGEVYRLPPTHLPDHPVHGLVLDRPWQVESAAADRVVLVCELPDDRPPFAGTVRHEIRLHGDGLDLAAEVRAARRMPAALGWHPWFRRPERGDLVVRVDADEVLVTDDDLVPTGARRPVTGPRDLRAPVATGARRLDHVYPHVRSPATLSWPDLELEIAFAPPLATVVVHTPASGVCVEPQTAWPNAPALAAAGVDGTGLVVLDAGEALAARVRWTWSTRPRPD